MSHSTGNPDTARLYEELGVSIHDKDALETFADATINGRPLGSEMLSTIMESMCDIKFSPNEIKHVEEYQNLLALHMGESSIN